MGTPAGDRIGGDVSPVLLGDRLGVPVALVGDMFGVPVGDRLGADVSPGGEGCRDKSSVTRTSRPQGKVLQLLISKPIVYRRICSNPPPLPPRGGEKKGGGGSWRGGDPAEPGGARCFFGHPLPEATTPTGVCKHSQHDMWHLCKHSQHDMWLLCKHSQHDMWPLRKNAGAPPPSSGTSGGGAPAWGGGSGSLVSKQNMTVRGSPHGLTIAIKPHHVALSTCLVHVGTLIPCDP
eukprot:gene2216-biopygen3445